MECDREAAAQAIAIDPLVTDLSIVPAMLEDIIKANRGYISKKWEKKKK